MRWMIRPQAGRANAGQWNPSEAKAEDGGKPGCNHCQSGAMQSHGNAMTGASAWGRPAVDPRFAAPSNAMPANAYFSPSEIAAGIKRHYGDRALGFHQRAEKTFALSMTALTGAMSGVGTNGLLKILGGNSPAHKSLARSIQRLATALKKQPANPAELRRLAEKAQWNMVPLVAKNKSERADAARFLKWAHGINQPGKGSYNGQGPFGSAVGQTPGVYESGNFRAGAPSQRGAKALAAAQSQLGVREASGNNDGVPSKRYAGGRREPWCADFVSWCFRQTGMELPGNQRSLASVQYMEDQMKKAGKFHTRTPAPGDIIFFKNRGSSDRGGGRHVGIVEKVENGFVYTIEGNTSNAVRRRKYKLDNPRIAGYGRG